MEVTSKDSIKDWIKVTLSGERKDDAIIRAAHYLIDYFLAYTIAGTEKGKLTYNELNDIINSLERSPLRYQFTLKQEFDRLSGKTDLSDKMVAPLQGIVDNTSTDSFKIPCYKIYMSPLFELYSYSIKKEEYQNLRFQHTLMTSSNKEAKPDLYYEDMNQILILDPKYKFDYDEPSYFEINDLERMFKYIASSKSEGGKVLKKKKAIFIFPTIKKAPKNPIEGEYLSKECIQIPQKDDSSLEPASIKEPSSIADKKKA